MIRKSYVMVLLCLLSAMIFSGCGNSKSAEADLKGKLARKIPAGKRLPIKIQMAKISLR